MINLRIAQVQPQVMRLSQLAFLKFFCMEWHRNFGIASYTAQKPCFSISTDVNDVIFHC